MEVLKVLEIVKVLEIMKILEVTKILEILEIPKILKVIPGKLVRIGFVARYSAIVDRLIQIPDDFPGPGEPRFEIERFGSLIKGRLCGSRTCHEHGGK